MKKSKTVLKLKEQQTQLYPHVPKKKVTLREPLILDKSIKKTPGTKPVSPNLSLSPKEKKHDHPKHHPKRDRLLYVGLFAKENKNMLERAFDELRWARETEINARHLLNINFGTQGTHYHKSVEQLLKDESGIGQAKTTMASKVSAKQAKSGLEVPFPQVRNNHFDLLWLGHIDQQYLIFKHGCKFKVIFNALWNMSEITDICFLRDQMLKMRQSLLNRTKRVIPHFLLETYTPFQSELLSLQKQIHFELKTLPLIVPINRKTMHGASPLGKMLLRPNVSSTSSSGDEDKSHEHRFVPIKQNMNMERKKRMPRTESEAAVEILPSNDEFMQKTNTRIVFKEGFNPKQAMKNTSNNKNAAKVIFKQLTNPLLFKSNLIATISVYVMIEDFETLRSHIFNNVKLRFRKENKYDTPESFNCSGFGLGPTLHRFGIDELIKFLHKRTESHKETLHEQKQQFWSRICQEIILILVMMKTHTKKYMNSEFGFENPLSKFCDLLQFRFQIDCFGKPWLFCVKGESTKFTYKSNSFDKFKRHLAIETILLIQKKLKVLNQKYTQKLKTQNLVKLARDDHAADKILNGQLAEYVYGDTRFAEGTKFDDRKQKLREMDRVLGQRSVVDEEMIIRTYKNFDKVFAPDKTTTAIQRLHQDAAFNSSIFDTNFNAAQMSERRYQRSRYLKMNRTEQNTNFFKHRYNPRSAVTVVKELGMTKEQRYEAERIKSYHMFEDQMKEDLIVTLNSETAKDLEINIQVIKRIGSVLLREGFRMVLIEEHKKDINSFINSYRVLVSVGFYHQEWVTTSLKFTILGVKDPLVFLCQCHEKLIVINKMKELQTKAHKIKIKHNVLSDELTEKEQMQIELLQQKEVVVNRRKTRVLNAIQVKNMIRKGATAIWFREQINQNFNEISEADKKKMRAFDEAIEFEKEKYEALQSSPFMRKQFVGNELSLGDKYIPMVNIQLKPTQELSDEESSGPRQEDILENKISLQRAEVRSDSSYDVNKSYASGFSGAIGSIRSNSDEDKQDKQRVKWQDANKEFLSHIKPILERTKTVQVNEVVSSSTDGMVTPKEEERPVTKDDKEKKELAFYQGLESHHRLSIGQQVSGTKRKSALKQASSLPVLQLAGHRDGITRRSMNLSQTEKEFKHINRTIKLSEHLTKRERIKQDTGFTKSQSTTELRKSYSKFLRNNFKQNLPYMKKNAKDQHNRLVKINKMSSQTRIVSNQDISTGPKHIPTIRTATASPFGSINTKVSQPKISVNSFRDNNDVRFSQTQRNIPKYSDKSSQQKGGEASTINQTEKTQQTQQFHNHSALQLRRKSTLVPQSIAQKQFIKTMAKTYNQRLERASIYITKVDETFSQSASPQGTPEQTESESTIQSVKSEEDDKRFQNPKIKKTTIEPEKDDLEEDQTIPHRTLHSEENETDTLKIPLHKIGERKHSNSAHRKKRMGGVKFHVKSQPAEQQKRNNTADGTARPRIKPKPQTQLSSSEYQINNNPRRLTQQATVHTEESERQERMELNEFFKNMRDSRFTYHQLYPLLESCNKNYKDAKNRKTPENKDEIIHRSPNRKEKQGLNEEEIYVPVREVTANITQGDESMTSRQYLIDNTINTLLKVFDTHDFYMQINDSEPSADSMYDQMYAKKLGKSKALNLINQ